MTNCALAGSNTCRVGGLPGNTASKNDITGCIFPEIWLCTQTLPGCQSKKNKQSGICPAPVSGLIAYVIMAMKSRE